MSTFFRAKSVLGLALLLALPAFAFPEPRPDLIKKVAAGVYGVAVASWWAFDPVDSTDAIQSAINASADHVVIPNVGAPWIIRPIKLRSNLTLELEKGVEIVAKKGEFLGKGDSLFSIDDGRNIAIKGAGATLRMHHQDYLKPPYEPAEWRTGINLQGCTNVLIEGLRIESTGGDGIYVGATEENPFSRNITIRSVQCHDNHRQGISVISAEDLLIEHCLFSRTNGTAPEAGIDFEPNLENERLVNCLVRNCVMKDNDGAGILVYLKPLGPAAPPVSLRFEKCAVTSGRDCGLAVGAVREEGPGGLIEFVDCTVSNTDGPGAFVYDKAAAKCRVRFTRCHWRDVNRAPRDPNDKDEAPDCLLLISAMRESIAKDVGGVDFVDCTVDDVRRRIPLVCEADKPGTRVIDVNAGIKTGW